VSKFPFSKNAAEYLQNLDIDIRTLPTYFPNLFKEAFNRLLNLMENKKLPEKIDISLNSPEALIYAIMRVFVELINEDFLRNWFAEAYSKRTENLLHSESPKTLITLASTTFDWKIYNEIQIAGRTYNWKLRFDNFLEVAPNLMAKDWKLVNQHLNKGWVLLVREKLIRLIAEKTKLYILNRKIPRDEIPNLPESYTPYLNALQSKINSIKKNFRSQRIFSDEINKNAYPPCIQFILKKTEKGENLAHPERLFLTFFLLNIGTSIEDILNIFKTQPDYNEEITRYQVEFAAGKRGSGTKYTSFGCPKLISYGLCKKELDEMNWCITGKVFKKVLKNPLQYYSGKIFLLSLKQENKSK